MFLSKDEAFEILYSVLNSYSSLLESAASLKSSANKVLKSYNKSASLFGMYYPDNAFYKYFKYRGRITKSDKKYTFKYYYCNDKVVLTERYSEEYNSIIDSYTGNFLLVDYIFYYYYQNYIDIIIYNIKSKKINYVGRVMYVDNKIYNFIESYSISNSSIYSFREYIFNDNLDTLKSRYYSSYTIRGEMKVIDKEEEIRISYG